ncbi:MAG: hemerythrin domain-containing protein [Acidobacteriota bacterium]|nr:hemerythrin domain-containing protein [Acidobacteriota bacterium]
MTDVFDILSQDHRAVEVLLRELATTSADAGPLGEKLVMEESRHEAAEEQHFWPTVRERVPDGDRLADRALSQEDEGKAVLDDLRKAEPGSNEFTQLVSKFTQAGRAHIAFEENEVWPSLRSVLTSEERQELGQKIERAKEAGPTRPHPNTPSSSGAQKTAGAAAAVADKAMDKLTGRGKK